MVRCYGSVNLLWQICEYFICHHFVLTIVADDLSAWQSGNKGLSSKVSLAGRADIVFTDNLLVCLNCNPLFLNLEVFRVEGASMQLGLMTRCEPALKG